MDEGFVPTPRLSGPPTRREAALNGLRGFSSPRFFWRPPINPVSCRKPRIGFGQRMRRCPRVRRLPDTNSRRDPVPDTSKCTGGEFTPARAARTCVSPLKRCGWWRPTGSPPQSFKIWRCRSTGELRETGNWSAPRPERTFSPGSKPAAHSPILAPRNLSSRELRMPAHAIPASSACTCSAKWHRGARVGMSLTWRRSGSAS